MSHQLIVGRRRLALLLGAVLSVVLVAGCSAGATTSTATSGALPSDSSAGSTSTGGSNGGTDPGFGLPAVQVIGPPTTGAGARPTFSWKPVTGASKYALTISTAQDGPLWAWQGTATSVILGGWATQPPDGAPGPLVSHGDRWTVAALDDKGTLIAISRIRPVGP